MAPLRLQLHVVVREYSYSIEGIILWNEELRGRETLGYDLT